MHLQVYFCSPAALGEGGGSSSAPIIQQKNDRSSPTKPSAGRAPRVNRASAGDLAPSKNPAEPTRYVSHEGPLTQWGATCEVRGSLRGQRHVKGGDAACARAPVARTPTLAPRGSVEVDGPLAGPPAWASLAVVPCFSAAAVTRTPSSAAHPPTVLPISSAVSDVLVPGPWVTATGEQLVVSPRPRRSPSPLLPWRRPLLCRRWARPPPPGSRHLASLPAAWGRCAALRQPAIRCGCA